MGGWFSKSRILMVKLTEGVDIDAASRNNILVANCKTPENSLQGFSSAEMAIFLLVSCLRQVNRMHKGPWGSPRGSMLSGKNVVLVGYGGIGKPLSKLLSAFGVNLTVLRQGNWTPAQEDEPFQHYSINDFETPKQAVLHAINEAQQVDAIILACPLVNSTRNLVDDDVIACLSDLKQQVHLINIGRGGLTERSAIEKGLVSGVLKGFGTDVWWEEPPQKSDSLLYNTDEYNVVISPHVGGVTDEGSAFMDETVAKNVCQFMDFPGKPLLNCKNYDQIVPNSISGVHRLYHTSNNHKYTIGNSFPSHGQIRKFSNGPQLSKRGDAKKVIDLLHAEFDESMISTSRPVLESHGKDEGYHQLDPPDVVFYPRKTEDVQFAVNICREHDLPIIPFGQGTSLEGNISALQGGLSMDFAEMNQVLSVNQEDMDCVIQPGCTRNQLNLALKEYGLFFPIDPGADASLGGMVSTRASGTNAVRYGTMKQNVLGLTAVLPNGEIVKSGGRARKSSAGYDITSLLVGSEGTLACITEIELKLAGIPEAVASAVCSFDPTPEGLHAAVDTVVTTLQYGIPIARAELLDDVTMKAVNSYSKMDYSEAPTLFLEFNGTEQTVQEQSEIVQEIASSLGGKEFKYARKEEDRNALWKARHMAYYASIALRPGCNAWPTDVCVPISKLAECILATSEDVKASGMVAPIFGHVGDGNYHTILLIHPDDGEEGMEKLSNINDRAVERALASGGTCTGEHGVGIGKSKWLAKEHGESSLELMRTIKSAVDPTNIMNPGKIIPQNN